MSAGRAIEGGGGGGRSVGRPRWTGSTEGKRARGRASERLNEGGRLCKAPSARRHLPGPHCLVPQTSPLLLPGTQREREREGARPFHAPTGCPSFHFAVRLFVFCFSIGMSTAQTRRATQAYVKGGWGGRGGSGDSSLTHSFITLIS